MLVNVLGAAATAVTVVVVILAKFTEGAWVTLVLIPAMIALMRNVRRHYDRLGREISPAAPLAAIPLHAAHLRPPIVVVPMESWNRVSEKALRFALTLSPEVIAVHVETADQPEAGLPDWSQTVEQPARAAGLPVPRLEVLKSPYRYVIAPVLQFVLDLEHAHPDRQIAVVIANLIERHWYHRFLHNQRGELLTALLLVKGDRRISIVNVPWYTNE